MHINSFNKDKPKIYFYSYNFDTMFVLYSIAIEVKNQLYKASKMLVPRNQTEPRIQLLNMIKTELTF